MMLTRIGGREYPIKSVPTCRTCQHPQRDEIENAMLDGKSMLSILKSLPEDKKRPSYDGIRAHFKNGHMPLDAAVQVALIERNAVRQGLKIEEAVDSLVDHITVAEMVVQKGFSRMQSGEIAPDMTDTLNAVKIVEQIQSRVQGDMDEQMWVSATMSMLEDARAIMTPAQWEQYGQKLKNNPILKALSDKQSAQAAANY
jgi:hypothetical protein